MTLEFSFKYKNFEARACDVSLRTTETNNTIELVSWQNDGEKDYCFTLAYFVRDKEGYYLKFVGDRPFEYIHDIDVPMLWKLLSYAQEILNLYYDEVNWEVNND